MIKSGVLADNLKKKRTEATQNNDSDAGVGRSEDRPVGLKVPRATSVRQVFSSWPTTMIGYRPPLNSPSLKPAAVNSNSGFPSSETV